MMWLKVCLLVLVLQLSVTNSQKEDSENKSKSNISIRHKRFLTFPPKSNMRLSACLAKGGIILSPPAFVFTFDMDLAFDLPDNSSIFSRGRSTVNRYRRELRNTYATMEALLERQGFDGRACVLRALCEAQQVLSPGKDGLMEDIFHAMFTLPRTHDSWQDDGLQDHDIAHRHGRSNQNCEQLYSSCPVSLINLALW